MSMRFPALALLMGCGAPPLEFSRDEAVTLGSKQTGLLYQSGSRLKIRWAVPVGDAEPAVALPVAIFDEEVGRECTPHPAHQHACIPVADKVARSEDMAYLIGDRRGPALIVADAECSSPTGSEDSEDTIWALENDLDDESPNRYQLDPPRIATHPWIPGTPGCVVHYNLSDQPQCVRPFRPLDIAEAVTASEILLGTDGGGFVAIVANDGAILPPIGDLPEYVDARQDIRCAIKPGEGACLPLQYGIIQTRPELGSTVDIGLRVRGRSNWAVFADRVWVRLSPPSDDDDGGQTVLSFLPPAEVLHFPSAFEGAGRIALGARILPDGGRVPVSLYDQELERPCVPSRTDDGSWRCTVTLPGCCDLTDVDDAGTEALAQSEPDYCNTPERFCKGGPIWLPGTPARGPVIFGYEPDPLPRAAIPARAARFTETPRETVDERGRVALVYDKVEDLDVDAFAEMIIVQDP